MPVEAYFTVHRRTFSLNGSASEGSSNYMAPQPMHLGTGVKTGSLLGVWGAVGLGFERVFLGRSFCLSCGVQGLIGVSVSEGFRDEGLSVLGFRGGVFWGGGGWGGATGVRAPTPQKREAPQNHNSKPRNPKTLPPQTGGFNPTP